jgi:UDP:flavonoid glycosyltransferase YjiC (YdhE family)
MKILLVTRGSQGDIYPYLRLAVELKRRGQDITLSLPRIFEKEAKNTGVHYVLQAFDDIPGMIEETPGTKNLLAWTRRVIDSQFRELIPLLEEHDIMVSSNTEFAAGSIAEFCGKPLIRTAFGPFLPSRKIPPPVLPWPQPHPIFRPILLWKLLNNGLNLMILKTLNNNRKALGMQPIRDQTQHAPETAFNYLAYSKYLGNIDNDWKYQWKIGGYCFNDLLSYDKEELERLLGFIKKNNKPTVFFSLGSCTTEHRDRFAEMLLDICYEQDYKLVVACGWWEVGAHLKKKENLYRMENIIPHYQIFPHCDALIHHGGAGTTHSAARSGRPQMVVPLLLDQFYWSHRVKELGIGPGGVRIKNISKKELERQVIDLVTNPSYKEKAHAMGLLIQGEAGLENICRHIENYETVAMAKQQRA